MVEEGLRRCEEDGCICVGSFGHFSFFSKAFFSLVKTPVFFIVWRRSGRLFALSVLLSAFFCFGVKGVASSASAGSRFSGFVLNRWMIVYFVFFECFIA
jgi:hypothetical protein